MAFTDRIPFTFEALWCWARVYSSPVAPLQSLILKDRRLAHRNLMAPDDPLLCGCCSSAEISRALLSLLILKGLAKDVLLPGMTDPVTY